MAIKINNNIVIDDNRQFVPITISAASTTGSSGQVLQSTGTGVTWASSGGSGSFDTGITTSIYVSVTSGLGTDAVTSQNIFSAPGIAYSFPSTAGFEYVIESMHITNKAEANLYLSGRHDFNGGQNVPIANKIPIPFESSIELLEQPRVANPSDVLRLQALTGLGTDATGHDGGLDAFIIISRKTDVNYIGIGETIVSTDQEIFTSVTYPSVIQSICLSNYNNNVDADVSISVFRGGTVGGISATGVRLGYLSYNLTIPKHSTIEICSKPKQLSVGDSILASATPNNSVGIVVAGKYIV